MGKMGKTGIHRYAGPAGNWIFLFTYRGGGKAVEVPQSMLLFFAQLQTSSMTLCHGAYTLCNSAPIA